MTREKIADTTTGITMELYQGEVDSVILRLSTEAKRYEKQTRANAGHHKL